MNLYVTLQQIQMVVSMLNHVEVKGKQNLTNQAACIEVLEGLQVQITEELANIQTQPADKHHQDGTDEE